MNIRDKKTAIYNKIPLKDPYPIEDYNIADTR